MQFDSGSPAMRAPRNEGALAPDLIWAALLQRALIRGSRMDAIQKRHRLGMTLLKAAARRGRFQWKAHLDVGGGEFVAGEPVALRKLRFPEIHVLLELRIDERRQRLGRH